MSSSKNVQNKSLKGFTLIEVIASVVIIMLIAISVLAMFPQAYNVTFQMGRKTSATNQAQQLIELFYNNPNTFIELDPNDSIAGWKKLSEMGSLESVSPNDTEYRFFYIDTTASNNSIDANRISVKIFYQNLTKHIVLHAMIPK